MINKIARFMSEKITSVEDTILLYQSGHVKSKINTAAFFIPTGITNVQDVILTPVASTNSANAVAFASYFEVTNDTSVASDVDAWGTGVVYETDQIVYDSVTGKAYFCNTAHTAGETFAGDIAKWTEIKQSKFVKVTATAAGTGKITDVNFRIVGY